MANYVNLLDVVYPVGSIIASYASTSPANWIGGTWTTMNAFLYGATSNIGATGGSAEHNHGLNNTGYACIGATGNDACSLGYLPATFANMGGVNAYTVLGTTSISTYRTFNHWTHLKGTTNGTSTLPPYTNVYYYRRIA